MNELRQMEWNGLNIKKVIKKSFKDTYVDSKWEPSDFFCMKYSKNFVKLFELVNLSQAW